jgi:hypothetical protein
LYMPAILVIVNANKPLAQGGCMFARQANYQRSSSSHTTYPQMFGYSRSYMTFSFFSHGFSPGKLLLLLARLSSK